MNATKWPSLTEFAKMLGREGICRVEEEDKGLMIAWVDNSPEALRRQDAIRKKERQDKGDETREQAMIREQIRRAKLEKGLEDEVPDEEHELKRQDEGEKITLNFGAKLKVQKDEESTGSKPIESTTTTLSVEESAMETTVPETAPAKVALKMGFANKPKNVFAAAKKNVLGGKKAAKIEEPKKMSEAERIMKEEIERKRGRDGGPGGPNKRPKF